MCEDCDFFVSKCWEYIEIVSSVDCEKKTWVILIMYWVKG
jgi:hypothetical protein